MPDNEKYTVDEFAEKIKGKYPEYKDVDNAELVDKIVAKYPEYEGSIKKKGGGELPGGGPSPSKEAKTPEVSGFAKTRTALQGGLPGFGAKQLNIFRDPETNQLKEPQKKWSLDEVISTDILEKTEDPDMDVLLQEGMTPKGSDPDQAKEFNLYKSGLSEQAKTKAKEKEKELVELYKVKVVEAKDEFQNQLKDWVQEEPAPGLLSKGDMTLKEMYQGKRKRQKEVGAIYQAMRNLDELETKLDAYETSGVKEALGFKMRNLEDVINLGWNKIKDQYDIKRIADKHLEGEELAPVETMALSLYGMKETLNREVEMPIGFDITAGTIDMVPYMISFMATGGIATASEAALNKFMGVTAQKTLKNFMLRGVNYSMAAATRVPGLPMTYEGFLERQTGDIGFTPEGKINIFRDESKGESLLKSALSTYAEVWTEGMFGAFSKQIPGIVKGKVPKNFIEVARDQVKFGKFYEEMSEELTNIGLTAGIEGQRLKDVYTTRNVLTLAGTVGVMSGAFSGSQLLLGNKDYYNSVKQSINESGLKLDPEVKKKVDNLVDSDKDVSDKAREMDAVIDKGIKDQEWKQEDLNTASEYYVNKISEKSANDVIVGKEELPEEAAKEKVKPKEPVLVEEEAIISEEEPLSLRTEKQIEDYGSKLDEKIKGRDSELSLGGIELRGEYSPKTFGEQSRYDIGGSRRVTEDSSVNQYSLSNAEASSLVSVNPNIKIDKSFSETNDSKLFHEHITASKEGNPYAASVFVYPEAEYEASRKFLTDDGMAGAAIDKDGTIISVFSHGEGKGRAPQVVMQAIKEGGRKLDHYDTELTDYYFNFGFVPVARVKWNDEFAPEDWEKETFKIYNKGKPDVVLMAYQGGDPTTLHERYKKFGSAKEALSAAPYVESFEQGQKLQDQFIKQATKLKTKGYEKSMQQQREDVYEKGQQKGKDVLRKKPEGEKREGKKDEVLKPPGRAKKMGEVREEGQVKEPILRQEGKPIRSVYSIDRDDTIRKAIQRTGNIQEKQAEQLIAEAESMEELDYLLSNNKVKLSPDFNKRKDALRKEDKFEDEVGRIKDYSVQLTALKSPKVEAKLKKDLGARYESLKEKKPEIMADISDRINRITGAKYAVGEDGAKPDVVADIVALIKDFAELGMINIELGLREAVNKLKTYIDDKETLKSIDDNTEAVIESLAKEMEEKVKDEEPPVEIPPEQPVVEKPIPEGKKRRRVAERLLKDPNLSKDIKEGLSEDAVNYVPVSNETTEHEAQVIIDEKYAETGSHDQSVIQVTDSGNKIPPRVRVVMAGKLIDALNKEMQLESGTQKTKLQNDAIKVAEFVTEFGTTLGQGIQAFNIWGQMNTETIIQKFNNDLEKARGKKLTPAEERKLRNFSKKVSEAKKGFQRAKAIHDMMAYQMRLEGIKWGDVAMSVWYAHVLSGYTTQQLNALANIAETAGEVMTSIVYNPKRAPWLLKGLFDGYGRGLLEAWATLKTGYAPVKSIKWEMDKDKPGVLEAYQGFKMFGRRWNPFRYHKYVPRIMSAVDTFFYHGLKGMRSYELAHMMIEGQGKGWVETNRLINEKLNNTKERKAEARKLLQEESKEIVRYLELELGQFEKDLTEAKTASDKKLIQGEIVRVKKDLKEAVSKGKFYKPGSTNYKRRFFELMEQSLPDEMAADMDDFASRGTFNYATEGRLGKVTDTIAALTNTKGLKAGKFVVPFTRIVSNVANRYLDWSPYGYYRAMKGGIGYKPRTETGTKYSREFTREEMFKEYIKASLGTLAAVALYSMTASSGDDDDSDGLFEITAAGTGDYRKNYNIKETGWQPYSIRVGNRWYSYMNTPMAIPLTAIGSLKDLSKYKGVDLEDKEWDTKAQVVLWNTLKYFTDLTFLRGLSEFMTNFSEEDPFKVANYLKRFSGNAAKGFVMPNLATQVSRKIQGVMELPMKEADTILKKIYRDMPIARRGLKDMVNGLGEPVVPDTDRYISEVESDPVWDMIVDNNAWLLKPPKNLSLYDLETGEQRMVEPDEYYEYNKLRGQNIKSQIEGNMDSLKEMKPQEVRETIKDIESKAGKEAKADLLLGRISYGLSDIKKQDPDAFEVLKDYKGFFDASSSVSIYVSGEERFMKQPELDEYRKLSLENYVKEIRRVTGDLNREKMDKMKAREIEFPGGVITNLEIKMDVAWAKAEAKAYMAMLKKIKKEQREK